MINETRPNMKKTTSRVFKQGRLAAALAIAFAASGAALADATPGTDASNWVPTRNQVHANVTNAQLVGTANDSEPVSITVTMKLRNESKLDQFIKEVHRPGSASFHKFLSASESTADYAPTQQEAQAVADHLTRAGFTNVQIAPNRMAVTAQGTVGAARAAFHTSIGHFNVHGHDAIANTAQVEVPAALSGTVDRVLGLQTLHRPQVFSRTPKPAYTVNSSGGHAYYPKEFATVYNAGSVPAATSTDVAIVGWGTMTNSAADLAYMTKDQGLPSIPTTIKGYGGPTAGATGNDDSGRGEWSMDAQAIAGVSGGVKSLTFYTAYSNIDSRHPQGSATNAGIAAAINGAVSDNIAKVINMSWGDTNSEVCSGTSDTAWLDSYFKLGVAQGQTFSVSSGDNGAYPCNAPQNGAYGDKTQPTVSYPATSPYVVSVGGTTLNTTTTDSYISETVWPYSGGGLSKIEAKPAWQTTVSGNYRAVPDMAFDADWNNSPIRYYMAYVPDSSTSKGSGITQSGYYDNGGTSLASPLFVGSWARLESAHGNSMGFAAPALYAYGTTMPVHDVTSGSNGLYTAGASWDNASGWGSFDISGMSTFITNTPGFVTTSNQH